MPELPGADGWPVILAVTALAVGVVRLLLAVRPRRGHRGGSDPLAWYRWGWNELRERGRRRVTGRRSPPSDVYRSPAQRGGGYGMAEDDRDEVDNGYDGNELVAPDTAPGAPAHSIDPDRWFAVDLEDHERDEPLAIGEPHTLAFGVDDRETARALVQTKMTVPVETLFDDDQDVVELTVQVDTDDFDVSDHERPLRLRRTGPSLNRARFDVVPLHEGDCSLTATLHRQGNFVHQMQLTFRAGEVPPRPVAVSGSGRTVSAASNLSPRDVLLVITPLPGNEYQCVHAGSSATKVTLSITAPELDAAVRELRGKLLEVVHLRSGGEYIFKTRIDIPSDVERAALRTMARAGARLFQQLFRGTADNGDTRKFGEWLRHLTTDAPGLLTIQIVSLAVPIPWPLLYLGDVRPGAELSWDLFLGMRHLVEQIPFAGPPSHDTSIVDSEPQLSVSLNLNTTIDTTMKSTFVADQQRWWQERLCGAGDRLALSSRTTRAEFVAALDDPPAADQIVYFYGHAVAKGVKDRGGPGASTLVFSDGDLTLADLSLDAPDDVQLPGKPLVVLNACESAELSPLFYEGFVPYFLRKGARGVVGTETKTPALFGRVWAENFFERLLQGQSIGQAVLEIRRDFVARHHNPLGLLYAVHCDQDTQIAPPLHVTPPAP